MNLRRAKVKEVKHKSREVLEQTKLNYDERNCNGGCFMKGDV